MSQNLRNTPMKMYLSYALNIVNTVNLLVPWFYYNLNFVRTNHLTLYEAPLQYLLIVAFPGLISEILYFIFKMQEVSDLIDKFESLVTTRKRDFWHFLFCHFNIFKNNIGKNTNEAYAIVKMERQLSKFIHFLKYYSASLPMIFLMTSAISSYFKWKKNVPIEKWDLPFPLL